MEVASNLRHSHYDCQESELVTSHPVIDEKFEEEHPFFGNDMASSLFGGDLEEWFQELDRGVSIQFPPSSPMTSFLFTASSPMTLLTPSESSSSTSSSNDFNDEFIPPVPFFLSAENASPTSKPLSSISPPLSFPSSSPPSSIPGDNILSSPDPNENRVITASSSQLRSPSVLSSSSRHSSSPSVLSHSMTSSPPSLSGSAQSPYSKNSPTSSAHSYPMTSPSSYYTSSPHAKITASLSSPYHRIPSSPSQQQPNLRSSTSSSSSLSSASLTSLVDEWTKSTNTKISINRLLAIKRELQIIDSHQHLRINNGDSISPSISSPSHHNDDYVMQRTKKLKTDNLLTSSSSPSAIISTHHRRHTSPYYSLSSDHQPSLPPITHFEENCYKSPSNHHGDTQLIECRTKLEEIICGERDIFQFSQKFVHFFCSYFDLEYGASFLANYDGSSAASILTTEWEITSGWPDIKCVLSPTSLSKNNIMQGIKIASSTGQSYATVVSYDQRDSRNVFPLFHTSSYVHRELLCQYQQQRNQPMITTSPSLTSPQQTASSHSLNLLFLPIQIIEKRQCGSVFIFGSLDEAKYQNIIDHFISNISRCISIFIQLPFTVKDHNSKNNYHVDKHVNDEIKRG